MATEAEIHWDAKTIIILIVVIIVAMWISHLFVKEKIGPNGKVFKNLFSTPSVPSGVASAPPASQDPNGGM